MSLGGIYKNTSLFQYPYAIRYEQKVVIKLIQNMYRIGGGI